MDVTEENFSGPISHVLIPFGNEKSSEIVKNPNRTGVNLSENCYKFVKGCNSQAFAGFTIRPILNWKKGFNRIYVNILVEGIDPPLTIQLKCSTQKDTVLYLPQTQTKTKDNWETLVFDMSASESVDYMEMSLFPTFGQSNVSPDQTFYFGDISFAWVSLGAQSISPYFGGVDDKVSISGHGFGEGMTVKFGDNTATDIVFNDKYPYLTFTCRVPPGSDPQFSGKVPVSITLVDGSITVIPVTETGGGFQYI
jgi:hypothetical protein